MERCRRRFLQMDGVRALTEGERAIKQIETYVTAMQNL